MRNDRGGPLPRIGEGLAAVGRKSKEIGQVVEGVSHAGMVGAEGFLFDRQRALVEPLRLGVLALEEIYAGQVVEGLSHVGMVGAEGLLPDRQRALIEPLRLGVLALEEILAGQVVEGLSHVGMVGAE